MDISNYLNDIPTIIMTAIAALSGTATGIGALMAWVAKTIKTLRIGKVEYELKAIEYEERAQRLEERSEKLAATGETFEQFGAVLTAFGERFDRLTVQHQDLIAKYDTLAAVLLLMAANTPSVMQSGAVESIKRLLNPDATDNTMEKIHKEVTNGEVDG